jgi:hypothetical protein
MDQNQAEDQCEESESMNGEMHGEAEWEYRRSIGVEVMPAWNGRKKIRNNALTDLGNWWFSSSNS